MSERHKVFKEHLSDTVLPLSKNHNRPSMELLYHKKSQEHPGVFMQSGSSDLDTSGQSCGNMSITVSEEELRNELSLLGFSYVPRQRLLEFKKDLEHLMNKGIGEASPGPSGTGNETSEETQNISALHPAANNVWDHSSTWPTTYPSSSNKEWADYQKNQDPYIKHTVNAWDHRLAARKAPQITRKVLRRKSDGQTHVSDESILHSETETEEEETGSSLGETHTESSVRSSADSGKSFIRPPPYSLLDQYRQRSDPVGRYKEYKQTWDALQVALERNKKELRWGIREQMMSAPPQPATRSVPLPNKYVVPTEKKRYALRWAIRQDMVNGIIPRGHYS